MIISCWNGLLIIMPQILGINLKREQKMLQN